MKSRQKSGLAGRITGRAGWPPRTLIPVMVDAMKNMSHGRTRKHTETDVRLLSCPRSSVSVRGCFFTLTAALLGAGVGLGQSSEASAGEWKGTSSPAMVDAGIHAAAAWSVSRSAVSPRSLQHNPRVHGLSGEAGEAAQWVLASGDNRGMPFAIVDKIGAHVFVFGADGELRGSAPALLGLAPGDVAVPGIGDRAMSRIRPEERTTPAGRFIASMGRNARGRAILWVDYVNAISMHPVIEATPYERRAERLASPTPLDNRISYGCINVPPAFFNEVVARSFSGTSGVVYVLPETVPAREFFSME